MPRIERPIAFLWSALRCSYSLAANAVQAGESASHRDKSSKRQVQNTTSVRRPLRKARVVPRAKGRPGIDRGPGMLREAAGSCSMHALNSLHNIHSARMSAHHVAPYRPLASCGGLGVEEHGGRCAAVAAPKQVRRPNNTHTRRGAGDDRGGKKEARRAAAHSAALGTPQRRRGLCAARHAPVASTGDAGGRRGSGVRRVPGAAPGIRTPAGRGRPGERRGRARSVYRRHRTHSAGPRCGAQTQAGAAQADAQPHRRGNGRAGRGRGYRNRRPRTAAPRPAGGGQGNNDPRADGLGRPRLDPDSRRGRRRAQGARGMGRGAAEPYGHAGSTAAARTKGTLLC